MKQNKSNSEFIAGLHAGSSFEELFNGIFDPELQAFALVQDSPLAEQIREIPDKLQELSALLRQVSVVETPSGTVVHSLPCAGMAMENWCEVDAEPFFAQVLQAYTKWWSENDVKEVSFMDFCERLQKIMGKLLNSRLRPSLKKDLDAYLAKRLAPFTTLQYEYRRGKLSWNSFSAKLRKVQETSWLGRKYKAYTRAWKAHI